MSRFESPFFIYINKTLMWLKNVQNGSSPVFGTRKLHVNAMMELFCICRT